jgi:hypothetical protein
MSGPWRPGGLLLLGVMLFELSTAQADDSWLRLQRLGDDQAGQLKQRQRREAQHSAPLSLPQQWSSRNKFRQQRQYLQALQDRQRHEQAALRQRQGDATGGADSRRQNLQLQRFRREQDALQQRFKLQTPGWPRRRY